MKCCEDVHTEAAFTLQRGSVLYFSLNRPVSELNIEQHIYTKDLTPDAQAHT